MTTKHSPVALLQVGAIASGILLLVVAVIGVVLVKGWNIDITLLLISFIFPLVGHVMGFLLALLTHQSWQRYSYLSYKVCVCVCVTQNARPVIPGTTLPL